MGPTNRRQWFRTLARGLAGAAVGGSAWSAWISKGRAAAVNVLRPPGALAEAKFQAACVKCGQCVSACPYDVLRLADVDEDVPLGTPTFDPRSGPCELCPDLPCVTACPTGALDPALTVAEDSRMGLAVLDPHSCLAFNGLRCEACYRACPLIDDAIKIEYRHQTRTGVHAFFEPVVNPEACTGCGQCERACPTDVASIKVFPAGLVAGRMGAHYRLGWQHDAPVTPDFRQGPQPEPTSPAGTAPGVDYLNEGLP